MKKPILLGLVIAVAVLVGINTIVPQTSNQPKKFSSQEELNSFVKENSQAGYYGGIMTGSVSEISAQKSASSDISQQSSSEAGAPASGGSVDYSQTNIQVAGVDEADIVKNDGKYIYAVSGNRVFILDAYPAENAKIVSTLEFNGSVSEIFINGNRLVVFGQESYQYPISKTIPTGGGIGAQPTLAVSISEKSSELIMRPYFYSPRTFIDVYDVSDKGSPVLARNISVDGSYYDSRMIGDYVYVIANQPVYNYGEEPVTLPAIYSGGSKREIAASEIYYFSMPDRSFIFTNILSLNTQNGEEPASKTFLMGYSQSMYVSLGNIYIVYRKSVSESKVYDRIIDEIIIPIVPLDVQGKISDARNSNASSYDKMQQIGKTFEDYLGTLNPEQAAVIMKTAEEKAARLQAEIAKEMEKTVIHKISIDNGNIDYKVNGEVPGQPLNQFSMDENSGYFRVATTTSGNNWGMATTGNIAAVQTSVSEQITSKSTAQAMTETQASQSTPAFEGVDIEQKKPQATAQTNEEPSRTIAEPAVSVKTTKPQVSGPLNHLYVLDGNLKIVGKVEDLAAGERIYSVRFMGGKAYMVTFRQIDPLFVIDLSSPQNPKVLGYLKIPGVSDYLHPYDDTHIIGVGRDASEEGRITGMKLALFDVSDVANPREVSKYIIGGRGTDSEALHDHKAFLFSREKNLLVIPVSEYSAAPETGASEWQWKTKYWQGAYVFNLDLANGFALKGRITHQNNTDSEKYYYDWSSQIRRSLYIENILYTISNRMIKMNSLSDLSEINKIELPAQAEYPYRVY